MSSASPSSGVRVLAPCKITPWLAIRGRRPDGYHDVDVGLLALELYDVLDVEPSRTGRVALALEGPFASADVPRDERNLAVRAAVGALEIARELGRASADLGLELRLEKHIPSRAGLGGGSSDAAAAALAVQSAVGEAIPAERLHALLASLGADCTFFVEAGTTGFARGEGRGDEVQPLPAVPSPWFVAVVAPEVGSSTAEVYAAFARGLSGDAAVRSLLDQRPGGGSQDAASPGLFEFDEPRARAALFNQLEPAALSILPELRAWRDLLDRTHAGHFCLSGSGSSFFGLFRDRGAALASLARIADRARAQGLALRGTWVARPAGHGARLVPRG